MAQVPPHRNSPLSVGVIFVFQIDQSGPASTPPKQCQHSDEPLFGATCRGLVANGVPITPRILERAIACMMLDVSRREKARLSLIHI